MNIAENTIIGDRYKIIKPIGKGGMAYVYYAKDMLSGSGVAVKIMHDELSDDPEFVRRFAAEARAAATLDHPNIIRILDYGQRDGLQYIVQEYVDGITLKEFIRRNKRLDYRVATPLVIQIGMALDHAHSRGIIHRDIKPQNILVTKDMQVKVADFGIARASGENSISLQSNSIIGSVHYFSPEQAGNKVVTNRSDLYSLGIIYYEMLTGVLPFDGESSVSVAIMQLQAFAAPPTTIVPDLPPQVDNIINKAMQKNPDDRYSSAYEFVCELENFMNNPNGEYGIVTHSANNTATHPLNLPPVYNTESGANYSRAMEIERKYAKRKSKKIRDYVLISSLSVLAVAIIALLLVQLIKGFSPKPKNQDIGAVTLMNFLGQDITQNNVQSELVKLQNFGIKLDLVYEANDSVLSNVIFYQDPESDGNLKVNPVGTVLHIKVSAGKDLVAVPDVVGETKVMAEQLIREAGFIPVFLAVNDASYVKDTVIDMKPTPGTMLTRGEKVEVRYSAGSKNVKVPDVTNKSYDEAKKLIEAAGLIVGPVEFYQTKDIPQAQQMVMSQMPAANTSVAANYTVNFVVCTKEELNNYLHPTTARKIRKMPDIKSMSLKDAMEILSSLGVSGIETTQWEKSKSTLNPEKTADAAKIYILEQNIAPGTELSKNTAISIVWGDLNDLGLYQNPPATTTTTTTTTTKAVISSKKENKATGAKTTAKP